MRSPAAKPVTPAPQATTSPTIWCPGTSGRRGSRSSPSTTCRSVRQMPQASTRSSTPSGPGCGTARVSARSGSPGACSTIACIVEGVVVMKL